MAAKNEVEGCSGGLVLITNVELRKILKEVLAEVLGASSLESSLAHGHGCGRAAVEYEDDQLIPLNDVLQLLKISKSNWWAGVKSARYPAPIRLSAKTVRWSKRKILQIVNQKEAGNE